MEEFAIEGEAVAYEPEPGSELGADGRYRLREADTARFGTRLLVVRPSDAAGFSGTVYLNWQNVSAGFEFGAANDEEIYRSGAAWVGVSAQKVGVDGFPADFVARTGAPPGAPLKRYDPARYGALDHPGDRWSYDMFTQVARAVGADRDRGGVDPLGGLDVEYVIATGGSQSAARLLAYINGVHLLTRAVQAYMPTIGGFHATPFNDGLATDTPAYGFRPCIVRDDLDVPVFFVNSEAEVPARAGVPIAVRDTDRFRLWEVAGTPHSTRREPIDYGEGWRENPLTYAAVIGSAFRHMQRWLREGTPPPSVPYVETAGTPPTVVRDEYGNARGGVRLPEMEAPTMTHEPRATAEGFGAMSGRAKSLPAEVLASLYPDDAAYVKAYSAAADAAVEAGTMLPEEAERLKAAAAGRGAPISWPHKGLG